jgi:hypothetical protein
MGAPDRLGPGYDPCLSIRGGSERYVHFGFYKHADVAPRPDRFPNTKSKCGYLCFLLIRSGVRSSEGFW